MTTAALAPHIAFRKGQTYGTILIDLTPRTPIDLLPDREKTTVENWLKEHPGAKIISRDRSAVYADAIRAGAPEAHPRRTRGDSGGRSVSFA